MSNYIFKIEDYHLRLIPSILNRREGCFELDMGSVIAAFAVQSSKHFQMLLLVIDLHLKANKKAPCGHYLNQRGL